MKDLRNFYANSWGGKIHASHIGIFVGYQQHQVYTRNLPAVVGTDTEEGERCALHVTTSATKMMTWGWNFRTLFEAKIRCKRWYTTWPSEIFFVMPWTWSEVHAPSWPEARHAARCRPLLWQQESLDVLRSEGVDVFRTFEFGYVQSWLSLLLPMLSLLGFLKGSCWNSYEFLMLLCVSLIISPSNLFGNELPASCVWGVNVLTSMLPLCLPRWDNCRLARTGGTGRWLAI